MPLNPEIVASPHDILQAGCSEVVTEGDQVPVEEAVTGVAERSVSLGMAERTRTHDWSATSLGPLAGWSRTLRAVTDIVMSCMQPMFVGWGTDLVFLYNDAYSQILGIKHPAALGCPFHQVWSEIWSDIKPLVDSALAGEATWAENLPLTVERNGSMKETWYTFSYSPIRDGAGRIAGMFCSCMETTSQVLAKQQYTMERKRFFELSNDLFGIATLDGHLISINPAWSRILQRSDEELLSRPFSEIIHPDDLVAAAGIIAALGRGEPVHQSQVRLLKSNGDPVSFAWSAVPEGIATARTFYTVGRDISEELRREEILRQSQKMEAVGQLTSGITHDFNNLLANICGSLEFITMRLAQGRTAEIEKHVTAAQKAADRAAALTQRLLAFSRRQALVPKPTDVRKLLSDMGQLIDRAIGPQIELNTRHVEDLWPSQIDPNQLENAILNLCINARDAMPDGGKIRIEIGNRSFDRRMAAAHGLEPGQYISLCVADSGTGMTPEVQVKAFEPFFTTKPIGAGTGLGLAMTYGFARQSGGTVTIQSEPGQGSTVCIYLPRSLDQADDVDKAAPLSAAPLGAGETVLVVDDETTVRMLISEMLSDLAYNVVEAEDAAAGLRVLGSATRVDLLVTDIGLPGHLDGRQLADVARSLRPGLKVLFITGYAQDALLDQHHPEADMNVLTKPFAMEALASKIHALIRH